MTHVFELTADDEAHDGQTAGGGAAEAPAADEPTPPAAVTPVLGIGVVLVAGSLLLRPVQHALDAYAVDRFGSYDPESWQAGALGVALALQVATAALGAGALTLALLRAARLLDRQRDGVVDGPRTARAPWSRLGATAAFLVAAATAALLLLPDRSEPSSVVVQDTRVGPDGGLLVDILPGGADEQ
ncbi:hypothetical protein ACPCUX_10680 [Cellulosimicrobium sp. AB352]|uniref:hypothetical protein n=1 Tax=Cellulosimicrobium sp. AB352 TaxID=3413281 RepID=UPI003C20FCB4